MFGKIQENPQTEKTPFYPRSPYGIAKVYAFWICVNYREAYGIYASNGILFNHESPIRGETFVTRKITRAAARIQLGLQEKLYLGNLDAKRDWGHARDFVDAQWRILQHDVPEDFVIATGVQHTIRQLVEIAFAEVGVKIIWKGEGVKEVGIDASNNKELIAIDPRYFRPTEVDSLLGDPSKAKKLLGWEAKISFRDMISEMVSEDIKDAQKDELCQSKGFRTYKYFE